MKNGFVVVLLYIMISGLSALWGSDVAHAEDSNIRKLQSLSPLPEINEEVDELVFIYARSELTAGQTVLTYGAEGYSVPQSTYSIYGVVDVDYRSVEKLHIYNKQRCVPVVVIKPGQFRVVQDVKVSGYQYSEGEIISGYNPAIKHLIAEQPGQVAWCTGSKANNNYLVERSRGSLNERVYN